ncbi:MAG: thiol peroxidase [Spirochaetes bacterium]|nr:thiol peroxidase [Spirochaetota bacterium]MBN2770437.1 thiol peroxidase [Spirochaetota bacterium]
MAEIKLHGDTIHTSGTVPPAGAKLKDFSLTAADLSDKKLADFQGSKLVLNIFPSVDTGVCAASVRRFNKEAGSLQNTVVLCISRDLPFAQGRFCGAEGLDNVSMLSEMRDNSFGKDYGVDITDGPLQSLLSRVVIVADADGKVVYSEQVPEIGQEPDYEAAIEAVKKS